MNSKHHDSPQTTEGERATSDQLPKKTMAIRSNEEGISIIIASWNAKALLCECLESLNRSLGQHSIEVIVVDNASSDGSPEMVADQYPSAKLIRNQSNLGFAKASNIGIRESHGSYVCLINSDVVVKGDCLGQMARFMDQNPHVGVIGPKILNADGTLQYTSRRFPTLWRSLCSALCLSTVFRKSQLFGDEFMGEWSHDTVRDVDYLSGCFLMLRRTALEGVGLLDERFFFYAEDKDLCKRFHLSRWDVKYFPYAAAVHYGGGSSPDLPKCYVEGLRANLQYWRKHGGRSGRLGFLCVAFVHQVLRIAGWTIVTAVRPSRRAHARLRLKARIACLRLLLSYSNSGSH